MKTILLHVLLLAALPRALEAQTILVYVEEYADGNALSRTHPLRDGMLAALFESGYVFFDPGTLAIGRAEWDRGDVTSLGLTALEGGAGLVLMARSERRTTARGTAKPRVDLTVSYRLYRVGLTALLALASDTVSASNAGREDRVDPETLGRETGGALVAAVAPSIAAAGAAAGQGGLR